MTIARIVVIVIAAASFSGCAILHPETSERSRASQTEDRGRRAMQYFIKAKTFEEQKNYLGAIVALRSAADLDPTSATFVVSDRPIWQLEFDYEDDIEYR